MTADLFPFRRVVVADTSGEFDFDLVQYGAALASLDRNTELVVLSRATRALQSFAVAPRPALAARGVSAAEKVSCQVLVEADVDGLLGSVRDLEADLMVVRSPQRVSRWRAVSRRLATESPCSICMVPAGSPSRQRCVVAGIDLGKESAQVLTAAASICRKAGAAEFVAVRPWFGWTMDPTEAALDRMRERAWSDLFRFLQRVDLDNVDCTPRVEESSRFSTGVLRVARERGADLIVAAAPEQQEDLARTCPIPLLLFRRPGSKRRIHGFLRRLRDTPDPTFG